jgi:hypothetical protein
VTEEGADPEQQETNSEPEDHHTIDKFHLIPFNIK